MRINPILKTAIRPQPVSSIARSKSPIDTKFRTSRHVQTQRSLLPVSNISCHHQCRSARADHTLWYRIPPVISKGYEPKGKYITLNGLKTCTKPATNSVHTSTDRDSRRRHRPIQCLSGHPFRLCTCPIYFLWKLWILRIAPKDVWEKAPDTSRSCTCISSITSTIAFFVVPDSHTHHR